MISAARAGKEESRDRSNLVNTNLICPETLCASPFSFGHFLRSKMPSSAPSPTPSQQGLSSDEEGVGSQFFSQKPSELPRPAAKRTTKKSPEQFAMNDSGLFFFTQCLLSTLLGKGQNWDGFGWGKLNSVYCAMEATSAAKSSTFFSMPSPFSKRVNFTNLISPPSSLATALICSSTVTLFSLTNACCKRQFSS